MSDPRFNIVFSGQLARGVSLETARANLARLFKIPEAKAAAMFSGKEIILKKNVDIDTAGKYRLALKKAGALVKIDEVKAAPVAKNTGKASFAVGGEVSSLAAESEAREAAREAESGDESSSGDEAGKPKGKSAPTGAQEAAKQDASETQKPVKLATQASELALMPSGAPVLNKNEQAEQPVADIDTSQLSMQESGGDLVESDELARPDDVEVDDLDADLAAPGAELLPDIEETESIVDSMDLSHMSLAERGEELGQAPSDLATEKREFDLSHLSLVPEEPAPEEDDAEPDPV